MEHTKEDSEQDHGCCSSCHLVLKQPYIACRVCKTSSASEPVSICLDCFSKGNLPFIYIILYLYLCKVYISTNTLIIGIIKMSKSRKQFMVSSSILPKNERNSLSWVLRDFRSFFGKIEDTIICFREFLTFREYFKNICSSSFYIDMKLCINTSVHAIRRKFFRLKSLSLSVAQVW